MKNSPPHWSENMNFLNQKTSLPSSIVQTLTDVYNEDQRVRRKGDFNAVISADLKNQKIIWELLPILEKYNWDKRYTFGKHRISIGFILWLIIQHADNNVDLQKEFLQKYNNRLNPSNKAYLQDRIAVNTQQFQTYATQWNNEGELRFFRPIEGINITKKIYTSEKWTPYIELNDAEIVEIDSRRNKVWIDRKTKEYYESISKKISPHQDGKIKMLINY